MILQVSGKNEFTFIPSIAGNETAEPGKQWRIIVRKINISVANNRFTFTKDNGSIDIDNYKYLKDSIIRHENAPDLEGPDKSIIRLTTDILFSDIYPELFPVLQQLLSFVIKLIVPDGALETKKL